MYISRAQREKLNKAGNCTTSIDLTDLKEKLDLILKRLDASNPTHTLTESSDVDKQEDITVEVDGETVVDTNENDVADTRQSEITENPAEVFGPEAGISQMLMDAIKDEYNTIQFYNSIIATAAEETGFENTVRILKHINEEEQIHVGMLQQLLKEYDTAAEKVDDGKAEATDIINDEELTQTDTAIEA